MFSGMFYWLYPNKVKELVDEIKDLNKLLNKSEAENYVLKLEIMMLKKRGGN